MIDVCASLYRYLEAEDTVEKFDYIPFGAGKQLGYINLPTTTP